jgi:hypothetical protein
MLKSGERRAQKLSQELGVSRQVIHFFGANPEECLSSDFLDAHEPGLFSGEEFEAGSVLMIQKIIQRKRDMTGLAKIPMLPATLRLASLAMPAYGAIPREKAREGSPPRGCRRPP